MRTLLTTLAVAALLALPCAARAETLPLDAFAGNWHAVDLTESAGRQLIGVVGDDLAVSIVPEGDGFAVHWTEYAFRGGPPGTGEVRRDQANLEFEPSDGPGLFDSADSDNPMDGGVLNWARLHDNVLSVYRMRLLPDGSYLLTSYDRAVEGDGMRLDLRVISGGAPVLQVTAQLVRAGG